MEFLKKFLDPDIEYDAIIDKYHKMANARASPGQYCPLLDLSGCTDHEKEIIREHNKRAVKRALQQELTEETYELPPGSAVLLPAVLPSNTYGIPLSVRTIGLSNSSGTQGAGQKPNPYQLMQKFLSVVPLRRYEGRLYRFTDGVFLQVTSDELQELITFVLEREIAAGSGPQIISEVQKMVNAYHGIKIFQTTDSATRFFFRNGAYNIQSGSLEPVQPFDFYTGYVDCEYPAAPMECPVFNGFLSSVSDGDKAIEQAIWEMIGYLLVPYDLNGKVFFVLQGVGNSGKSVLGSLITSFFNKESVAHLSIFRFQDRFSTSSLVGKRLNVSMDLPKEKISREAIGTIKMVTGNDVITVEAKYKDAKSYKPTCKLLFGTNFPILVADNDDAFMQRMVVIPFQYPVPEEAQDKHLLDKLMLERPAIAAKAIDAYRNLVSRNYEFIRPAETVVYGCPPLVDILLNFLDQCCVLDAECFTSTLELQTAFNEFCFRAGLPSVTDRVQFSRQLNSLCAGRIQKAKHRQGEKTFNGYTGIRLLGGD